MYVLKRCNPIPFISSQKSHIDVAPISSSTVKWHHQMTNAIETGSRLENKGKEWIITWAFKILKARILGQKFCLKLYPKCESEGYLLGCMVDYRDKNLSRPIYLIQSSFCCCFPSSVLSTLPK